MRKIRLGFVSNSSSSSFVCEVCGTTESGMDASASDFDMAECQNGHTYCLSHRAEFDPNKISNDDWLGIIEDFLDPKWYKEENAQAKELLAAGKHHEILDLMEENSSESPWFLCPICTMTVISEGDMKSYLKKITGVTESEVFEEIKKGNRRRKKLYDSEYNEYATKKLGRAVEEIEKEIVEKFSPDYSAFLKFLSE
jgi:hypothetical protein